MVVGVVIPDRGDRPQFLEHLKWMIRIQTLQPSHIELVNYKPISNAPDLTERVRVGFKALKAKGCDCVLIIENDDWYKSTYIEEMVNGWIDAGKSELFGTDYTYYYHIFKRQYRLLKHPNRASLMNTLISCETDIQWCNDNEVYLDLHIWKKHQGKTFSPKQPIALGIKHGIGKCGGNGHFEMQFPNIDMDFNFLSNIVDYHSFRFYSKLCKAE